MATRTIMVDPLIRETAALEVAKKRQLRTIRNEVARSSQSAVARRMKVTPSAINQKLATADKIAPEIPEGFSAAGPYEIAQLAAIGEIDRETLVDELVRWPYVAGPASWGEAWDTQAALPAGTWQEVLDAYDDGLIDADLYEEVDLRIHP